MDDCFSPTGRYFGGTPQITSLNPIAYSKIMSLEFFDSGCPITYQLSSDGSNYWYWDSNVWAMATGSNLAETVSASVIAANITSFSDQVGAGYLQWRAFMSSDTAQTCELNKVTLRVFK